MKKNILILTITGGVLFLAVFFIGRSSHEWEGVDKTVVERIAAAAGRAPRKPLFDTEKGDVLLFAFLVAGACGGFVAGYSFRRLFSPDHGVGRQEG
jgi:cobalt/nickel transport protein